MDSTDQNKTPQKNPIAEDDNVLKAKRKIDELKEKLKLAEKNLADEQNKIKNKNKNDVTRLLSAKGLFKYPLSVWDEKLPEIKKLLES